MLKTILTNTIRAALLAGFIAAPMVAQAEIIETRTISPGHVQHHHGYRHHHNGWRHHHHHPYRHHYHRHHHGHHHHHHHRR